MSKQADTVKSRAGEGKPATSEVRQLVGQVDKLAGLRRWALITSTNWQAVQSSLGKLQQAFGLTP